MIGDQLGIGHDPGQHAAYVKSWVQVLKEDPKEILRASRDADKISNYVMGLDRERLPANMEKLPPVEHGCSGNSRAPAGAATTQCRWGAGALIRCRWSQRMSQLILDVPDDSLLSLKLSDEAAAAEIRLAASMKLYELGRLSSGAAARLAGIPRTLFLSKLADYGVDTFRLTEDELERQTSLA